MSASYAFTASTGMLLPVYSDFLNAGETIHLTDDLFARTQPLVTAAMADVDFYLDWFFVPMSMLYTGWGQVRMQTTDYVSSFYAVSGQNRLRDSSGYFPLFGLNESVFSSFNSAASFGFGQTWPEQQVDSSDATSESSMSLEFDSVGKGVFRMLDALGYNPYGIFAGLVSEVPTSGPYSNPRTFPWKACAYQCIYQNWYRNDDYEPRLVASYNLDKFAENSPSFISLSFDNPCNPFLLKYCDYRRDYFTSIKPSPIISTLNTQQQNLFVSGGTTLTGIQNFLSSGFIRPAASNNGTPLSSPGPSVGGNVTQVVNAAAISGAPVAPVSTGSLRSMFAVEKLLRITGRASKDYDAQVLAHYGFKIPHDVKHDITHLRSSHALLHIGEVVSTADTGQTGSALGEIAGKGYVSIHNDKKLKYTAPVDGALMCIFRAVPRQRIVAAFDKQNSVASRLDLYVPAFDKLGMQPLYDYEYYSSALGTSATVGWQFRYEQYKRKFDRASIVFDNTSTSEASVNQYSAWVLTRRGLSSGASFFNPFLKCPPTALNSIMVVPYVSSVDSNFTANGNPATSFYTDPFICDFRANVKKVSTMSPTGEPDMISF